MKLIHISDLHFPTKLPWSQLRGKAIVGYTNYSLRRRKKHNHSIVQSLIQTIRNIDYDALVISGDITNVSHPKEFEEAKELLAPLLDERVFMVPGNHDRYQKKSVHPVPLFESFFGPFLGTKIESDSYLRKKEIAGHTFFGWDSNQPLAIAKANGEVSLEVVKQTLAEGKKNYILVCHHPIWNPNHYLESNGHKMVNRKEVAIQLQSNPPFLYLHGHSHSNWHKLPGNICAFHVLNSASSTRSSDAKHLSGFHIVSIQNAKIMDIQRMSYQNLSGSFEPTKLLSYQEEDGQV
ncbi:calcineurin-like phosphoesterase family protein [Leptospira ryugenii]|uniref:Calcineurin-like phosphoesterase family protein n=1 Tax=Leptospira ryugenii TaxID=1917863 RepID=A0A2P2DYN8_9LEPT|nr:metallophosphoesterase [Leptospira ryugenii]GBF49749.1 calcineurin-like phosphoesterase family protein [Leptospira ryugenii]